MMEYERIAQRALRPLILVAMRYALCVFYLRFAPYDMFFPLTLNL